MPGSVSGNNVIDGSYDSRFTLGNNTIRDYDKPVVNYTDVVHNAKRHKEEHAGGQAKVFLSRWENVSPWTDKPPIPDGTEVAIKLIQPSKYDMPRFEEMTNVHQYNAASYYVARQLRVEINILHALHHRYPQGYCGSRVVEPSAIVRWPGEWHEDAEKRKHTIWQPTYGYLLPTYELGSMNTLLNSICHNVADPDVARRFLSYRNMSSELLTLARELRKIHTIPCGGKGLVLQDLTDKNLLCKDDPESGGVHMLFSDPAMAMPAHLIQRSPRSLVCGTWLFGSSKARNLQFDPKADLYSLCCCFADLWSVAEGAPVVPSELAYIKGLDSLQDREQGVQLVRTLMVTCLKVEFYGKRVARRAQRHTPVAWLGAWAILLGFRDYKDIKHWQEDRLPCLRPTETQMLPVFEGWARVVALAEEVPLELTAEQARSPACAELVTTMTELLGSLVSLSHLGDAGPQQDESLAWLAANFMALDHPLVAAMREQGAMGMGQPEPPCMWYKLYGWTDAMLLACREVESAYQKAPDASPDVWALGIQFSQLMTQWMQKERISLPPHLRRAYEELAACLGVPTAPVASTAAAPSAVAPSHALPRHSDTPASGRVGTAAAALDGADLAAALVAPHMARWQALLGDPAGKQLIAGVHEDEQLLESQRLAGTLEPALPGCLSRGPAAVPRLYRGEAAAALLAHEQSMPVRKGSPTAEPDTTVPLAPIAAAAAGPAASAFWAICGDSIADCASPAKRRRATFEQGTPGAPSGASAAAAMAPAADPAPLVRQLGLMTLQPAAPSTLRRHAVLRRQAVVQSAPAPYTFSLPQPAWQVPAAAAPSAAASTPFGSPAPTALPAAVGAQPAAAPAACAGSGGAAPAFASEHGGGGASSAYGWIFPAALAGSRLAADGAASPGPGGCAAFSAPFSALGGSFGAAAAAPVFVGGVGSDGSPAQPAGAASGHPRTQALPPPAFVPAGGSKGNHVQDVGDVARRLEEMTDPFNTERPPVFAGIDTADRQLEFLQWLAHASANEDLPPWMSASNGSRARGDCYAAVIGADKYTALTRKPKLRTGENVRKAAAAVLAHLRGESSAA